MKKALLILAVIVVLAGIGYAGFNLMKDEETTPTTTQTTNIPLNNTQSDETGQVEQESTIELTAADLEYLGSANRGKTVDATDQAEVTVTMSDFRFDTTYLRIKKGTKVTWVNEGSQGHDVTPATTSPQKFTGSDLLATGGSYSLTFDEIGKYYYLCTPHSSQMRAIVEVVQ